MMARLEKGDKRGAQVLGSERHAGVASDLTWGSELRSSAAAADASCISIEDADGVGSVGGATCMFACACACAMACAW